MSKTTVTPRDTDASVLALHKGCKPSACAGKNSLRPQLCHGVLRKRGDEMWLYTSDSFCAVGIKVNASLKEGYVPIDVLKLIEKGRHAEQVDTNTWSVQSDHGSVVHTLDLDFSKCTFVEVVGPMLHDPPAKTTAVPWAPGDALGINANLMKKVSDAMGSHFGVKFAVHSALKPIRVMPLGGLEHAVAVIMPMRVSS